MGGIRIGVSNSIGSGVRMIRQISTLLTKLKFHVPFPSLFLYLSATQQAFGLFIFFGRSLVSALCLYTPGNTCLSYCPTTAARSALWMISSSQHETSWLNPGRASEYNLHLGRDTTLAGGLRLDFLYCSTFHGLKIRGLQQCTQLGPDPRQKFLSGYSIPQSLLSLVLKSIFLNTTSGGFLW